MSGVMETLAGTLIARVVSDDLHGDIPGRRLAIAESIATLAENEEPSRGLDRLWVLNRFRNQELLGHYRQVLRCHGPLLTRLRGQPVTEYASGFTHTRIVELPFDRAALDACGDPAAALRYLANPNVGRNAALTLGATTGASRTFVLDGDIYVPRQTFEGIARLIAAHGPSVPVWLFTMRAWSLEQFAAACPVESSGQSVTDACGSTFVLNSWPPQVSHLGDEGMLGLPAGVPDFDERREYSNDSKVAYCTALRTTGAQILTPTYPVCHLEHRAEGALAATLSEDERQQALLEHRLWVRAAAKREMLERWRPERERLNQPPLS